MIRKAVISVLTAAAITLVTLMAVSEFRRLAWYTAGGSGPLLYVDICASHVVLSVSLNPSGDLRSAAHAAYQNMDAYYGALYELDPRATFRCLEEWHKEAGWQCELANPCTNIFFPLWAPAVLFATYPTIALARGPVRRYRRRKRGLCIRCGYDLTGNVSGTCPECGEAI